MKWSKKIFFVGIIIILIVILSVLTFYKTNNRSDVAAIVNGESIYISDINKVMQEYDESEGISYDKILENTINELLIVQYGRSNKIVAYESEINDRINYVKNTMPEIYEEIEKNGLDKYKKNMEMLIIYDKAKKYYLEQFSSGVSVTETEALDWYTNNISTNTEGFARNKDMIISKLEEEKKRMIILELVEKLKKDGEIKIYRR